MHSSHRILAPLCALLLSVPGLSAQVRAPAVPAAAGTASGTPAAPAPASVAGAAGTLAEAAVAGPMIGFGTSTVASGDELFVGRPGQSAVFPMPGSEPGTVHVFRSEGDEWVETAMVGAEDVDVSDAFGQTLAVDGDILVVGAPGTDEGRGAVHVFTREADGWSRIDRLAPEALETGDGFGSALGIAGDDLMIGAPGRGGVGAVFAYRREAGELRMTEIAPAAGDADAHFGASLDLAGDRLLVGAPGPFAIPFVGSPPAFQSGSAYVFERAEGAWTESAQLLVPSGGAFGLDVALTAGEALVGSPLASQGVGSVFRFAPGADGTWTAAGQIGPASPQGQALFGHSITLAGDQLVVGAPLASNGQGLVYAFSPTGEGDYVEAQVLSEETRGLLGFFGSDVAGSEELLVVGAPAAEFFEGIGYVYTRAGDEWTPVDEIVEAAGGLPAVEGGELRCSEDGMVAGFACDAVDLVSFLPVDRVGGQRGIMVSDIWGWTDPDTGREYAILGRFDGTSFIDVSDPESPVYLGNLPLTEGATPNLWRDMKVYANHAYIVADNAGEHGMQVFDLTRLRDVTAPPAEFEADAVYDGIHSAHNIVINEETGFAYAVGSSGGGTTCGGALHMIDIRDPKNPTFAGCYADPGTGTARTGYTHDAQCVIYHGPDEDYAGREICFNASETALGIGDLTDKENPAPIASASYPNVAYAHQGWLSEDQRYFYLNDELDELQGVEGTRTLVWDVVDLDDPVLVTEYISENPASDHNLYVRGQLMYQSNYVSGLRVFDISDPENPQPVGHFDTVPGGADTPGFAGSWSNYPFFESGIIIVSSMREGLFVLRKRQPELVP